MGYPEKILADDEQIVARLHPHWITLVPATLWFVVICAAAGVGIAFAPDSGAGRTAVLLIIVVVGLALLGVLSFRPWLAWRTTHFVFTTHRVLIRRGVLRHTGRDIMLQRITDVAFSQTLWDRIVKAGTVTIESAGEHGEEVLHDMPNSERVQQMLNRLVEADGERRSRGQQGAPYPQGPYPPAGQQGYGAGQRGYPPPAPRYPPTQQFPPQ